MTKKPTTAESRARDGTGSWYGAWVESRAELAALREVAEAAEAYVRDDINSPLDLRAALARLRGLRDE